MVRTALVVFGLMALFACGGQQAVLTADATKPTLVAERTKQTYDKHKDVTSVVAPRYMSGFPNYYLQAVYRSVQIPGIGNQQRVLHGMVIMLVVPANDPSRRRYGNGWSKGRMFTFTNSAALLTQDIFNEAMAEGFEIEVPRVREHGNAALWTALVEKRVLSIPAEYFQGFNRQLPCHLPNQACVSLRNLLTIQAELKAKVEQYKAKPEWKKLPNGFLLL